LKGPRTRIVTQLAVRSRHVTVGVAHRGHRTPSRIFQVGPAMDGRRRQGLARKDSPRLLGVISSSAKSTGQLQRVRVGSKMKAMGESQVRLHTLPEECISAIIFRLPLASVGHASISHRSFASACKQENTWKALWYCTLLVLLLSLWLYSVNLTCEKNSLPIRAHIYISHLCCLCSFQMPSLLPFAHIADHLLPGYAGMSDDDPTHRCWSLLLPLNCSR
jgi:hypothetical protein